MWKLYHHYAYHFKHIVCFYSPWDTFHTSWSGKVLEWCVKYHCLIWLEEHSLKIIRIQIYYFTCMNICTTTSARQLSKIHHTCIIPWPVLHLLRERAFGACVDLLQDLTRFYWLVTNVSHGNRHWTMCSFTPHAWSTPERSSVNKVTALLLVRFPHSYPSISINMETDMTRLGHGIKAKIQCLLEIQTIANSAVVVAVGTRPSASSNCHCPLPIWRLCEFPTGIGSYYNLEDSGTTTKWRPC